MEPPPVPTIVKLVPSMFKNLRSFHSAGWLKIGIPIRMITVVFSKNTFARSRRSQLDYNHQIIHQRRFRRLLKWCMVCIPELPQSIVPSKVVRSGMFGTGTNFRSHRQHQTGNMSNMSKNTKSQFNRIDRHSDIDKQK